MLRKGARGLFNRGLAKSKLSSITSRSFQIEKTRKLNNGHGGMIKIEADDVKMFLKKLEEQENIDSKISSAKRKLKNA